MGKCTVKELNMVCYSKGNGMRNVSDEIHGSLKEPKASRDIFEFFYLESRFQIPCLYLAWTSHH